MLTNFERLNVLDVLGIFLYPSLAYSQIALEM